MPFPKRQALASWGWAKKRRRRHSKISLPSRACPSAQRVKVSMPEPERQALRPRPRKTIPSTMNHRWSTITTTTKVLQSLRTIRLHRIMATFTPGSPTPSGSTDSGSPGSSVFTIFTGVSLCMGTGDSYQTIFGIQGQGRLVELILEEDTWEIRWRTCPIQEALRTAEPVTERRQSQGISSARRLIVPGGFPAAERAAVSQTGILPAPPRPTIQEAFRVAEQVAAGRTSGAGRRVSDRQRDTGRPRPDTHQAEEFHPALRRIELHLSLPAA